MMSVPLTEAPPVPLPPAELLWQSFQRSDTVQIMVSLNENQIVFLNQAAKDFYGLSDLETNEIPFTDLYSQSFGALHTLTEAALTYGHTYGRVLLPDCQLLELDDDQKTPAPPKYEHEALHFNVAGEDYLHISITALKDLHRRNLVSDADYFHQLGLDEWRRMEHYFREIELHNQLILSAAGEGIYGIDDQGRTTFVNRAAEEILGWTADEIIGKDMHELVHHSHADGSHYHSNQCPIYGSFRKGKTTKVDDEVFWHREGRPIQVEYTSTPVKDGDAVVGAVIVFRDVQLRRQREAQLQMTLAENSRLREQLEQENAYLQEEIRITTNASNIIGTSAPIQHILQQVQLAGPTDANILITGESGTGKELVARAMHEASSRADKPLIRVNCAAIPGELFESEFFGHTRGAFTGAIRNRIGRFELAHQGTLFLDEVGEIPLELQSKLLRVLQDQKFERVGEDRTREAHVRIIAATNRNLKAEVAAGRFREDLYFRLNVFPVECASLRDRAEDIPMLAQFFLEEISARLNISLPILTQGNIEALKAYDWPGNVRELQNVMERAAILSVNGRMQFEFPNVASQDAHHKPTGSARSDLISVDTVYTAAEWQQLEKQNISRALIQCGNRVSGPGGAAELLGLKATTLYSKIKKFGL